jgi:hypothetical protein
VAQQHDLEQRLRWRLERREQGQTCEGLDRHPLGRIDEEGHTAPLVVFLAEYLMELLD